MKIMDLNGKVIEVDNLDLALQQADVYRHTKHVTAGFEKMDEKLNAYWEDCYQKLLNVKEAGG